MQLRPAPPPALNQYVPALTGLRAMAAYLVFLHHYNPGMPGTFVHRLFAQGYIGVSVFFVLSGFLIYHRYADEYLRAEKWSWRRYLQNRFARIFPLYTLLMLLTISVDAARSRAMSWPELLVNLTLLKGFFEEYKFSGIAQSWSLTVEGCFYLIAPLLFVIRWCWESVLLTAGLLGIGLLLWVTVGSVAWHGLFGSLTFVLFYTFFGRGFEFVAGMWLARRWHESQLPPVPVSTGGGLGIMSLCVLWQTTIPTVATNPAVSRWSEFFVYTLLLPVGIVLFLLGLLREKTALRRVLTHQVVQVLGRGSYAFYLIHVGVVAKGLQAIGVTQTGCLFGGLVLLAHGLYAGIEKPLHRWLRAF